MKDNVHELLAKDKMTVDEAFAVAQREQFNDVIVIGYDKDGDFLVTSSHVSNKDALYLLKLAELHIMGIK